MKTVDLRKKSEKELFSLLSEERERLRKLRFQRAAGQLKQVNQMKKGRKAIAQILTILKEKHA
jgi:ribosomal protein L29